MNEDDITFGAGVDGEVIAWQAPAGISAEADRSVDERVNYYIATQTLKKGHLLLIPKRETVVSILDAWDMANCQLIVEDDAFFAYTIDPYA
jgi:hypothetical protein